MAERRAINFKRVRKIELCTEEEHPRFTYRQSFFTKKWGFYYEGVFGYQKADEEMVKHDYRFDNNKVYYKPYIKIYMDGYSTSKLEFDDVETARLTYYKLVIEHKLTDLNALENQLKYE